MDMKECVNFFMELREINLDTLLPEKRLMIEKYAGKVAKVIAANPEEFIDSVLSIYGKRYSKSEEYVSSEEKKTGSR